MVFTLLVEVLTFHVGPIVVDVRSLGLELVPRFRSTLCLGLEERLNDSIQVPLAVTISIRIKGRWSLRGSRRSLGKSRSRGSFGRFRFV